MTQFTINSPKLPKRILDYLAFCRTKRVGLLQALNGTAGVSLDTQEYAWVTSWLKDKYHQTEFATAWLATDKYKELEPATLYVYPVSRAVNHKGELLYLSRPIEKDTSVLAPLDRNNANFFFTKAEIEQIDKPYLGKPVMYVKPEEVEFAEPEPSDNKLSSAGYTDTVDDCRD